MSTETGDKATKSPPSGAKAPIGGVGFQVVTNILLVPHPDWAALTTDQDQLRKDMAAIFSQVLVSKLPEMAEANGYTVETVETGVKVLLMEATDEPLQG